MRELFHFAGDREAVRRQTVAAALEGVRQNADRLTRLPGRRSATCPVWDTGPQPIAIAVIAAPEIASGHHAHSIHTPNRNPHDG